LELGALGHIEKAQLAVVTAGGQLLAVWAESDGVHQLGVRKARDLCLRGQLPTFNYLVAPGGKESGAVGAEGRGAGRCCEGKGLGGLAELGRRRLAGSETNVPDL